MERYRFSVPDRKEPWDRQTVPSGEACKGRARKLRLIHGLFAVIGGVCLAIAIRGYDFTLAGWLGATLVHCLFILPAAIVTQWSLRLRSRDRSPAKAVTLLARILTLLPGLFWFLTFLLSLDGPDEDLFMRIWSLLAAAANGITFVFTLPIKTPEKEM